MKPNGVFSYKDKEYPSYMIGIWHKEIYPDGHQVRLAPESLRKEFEKDNGEDDPYPVGSKASVIDCMVYHYVDDDVLKTKSKKEIAKHYLDEEFQLSEEEIMEDCPDKEPNFEEMI